jgi:hypothetical protein
MPRSLSSAARQAIYAQQTDKVFLALLTISHSDLAGPIRVVNDLVNLTSRGDHYLAFPFQIVLPEERDDQLGQVQLSIDNVDRTIVEAVRTISSPASIRLEIVIADQPDTVEAGPFDFTLRNVEYDALTVTGTLMYEDILNEPVPADSFTPNFFPGLFR